MVEAYVLLKVSQKIPHSVQGLVNTFKDFKEVEEAEILFGDYDMILKLRAGKVHDIENFVLEKMKSIDSIDTTMTMLCVNEKVLEKG
jgi:DNA-binding Lrp family transcriptional regulator